MKKLFALFIAIYFVGQSFVKADEGMWLLAFIHKNYEEMKAMGFKLSPEDIYSVNRACLKDAIVALDYGNCTGELVSPYGLVLTNHHCAYEDIQKHSTVEHDYLTDGFWASKRSDELPNPEKTVSFLQRMEDVTDRVLASVNAKMSEEDRETAIRKISEIIQKEAVKGTHYEAKVVNFFEGNNYYLFVYEVFRDVRLVGAPPSSIGKFGHDTDNWMWPRHTGDFSMYRIYCAPDGKPADYDPANVPLQPKKFLPINISGIKENDFTMVLGFPGSTNRYLTSWEVSQKMKNENDIRVKVRTEKQRLWKEDMEKDARIRIAYSAKYAQSSNYWKYSIGQNKGLTDLKVIERKQLIEKELTAWIKADKANRSELYGNMLQLIEKGIKDRDKINAATNYWFEAFYSGSEIIAFSFTHRRLDAILQSGDKATAKIVAKTLGEEGVKFFKDFNLETDKKVAVAMLKMYADNVDKAYLPSFYDEIKTTYGGDYQKYVNAIFEKSIFVDQTKYNQFLEEPTAEVLANDPAYKMSLSVLDVYWKLLEAEAPFAENINKGKRLYIQALMKMELEKNPKKLFSPDANSTMRCTYGTIGGYKVNNKTFDYITDLDGYMAKEDPKNPEFVVSERLKELWKAKDFGKYGENGKLITCFTSNNDITGGNSGSPVLNAKGELIGIAFDGNWEAMSGDIAFETALQKTICVDIRFVLFTIEKYAGASHLVDEMTLVKE